ncbi:MAG: PilC/PilY family type IV pilus protein [Granulosicoccus sp.]
MKLTRKLMELSQGNGVGSGYRTQVSNAIVAALFAAATLLCAQASADDTEIFFAEELSSADSTANVLFMFDTSGSMADYDGGNTTRLSRLKEAMSAVVNSSSNVNIAIGSFSGNNKGSIQLPAVNVDADICPDAGCNNVVIRSPIRADDDDAEQYGNGDVELNGHGLDVQSGTVRWALRFDDLNIPRGATINSANLQLISHSDYFNFSTLTITGEAADHSEPLLAIPGNITSRTAPGQATATQVVWNVAGWRGNDYQRYSYDSPNLNTLVSEITDRPGWCGGNALTLMVEVSGDARAARSHDNDPYLAPVLQVDYSPASVDWSDTCLRTKSVSHIALGIDDMIEDANTGVIEAVGDQLRTHVGTSPQTMGLRFTDVELPANANITSAYLELPFNGSLPGDVDLTIRVEDSAYSNVVNPVMVNALGSRTFTSDVVVWEDVPDNGSALRSPDISDMVSNLVSKAGWASMGAMTFTLTPTAGSTGQRFFDAIDSPAGAGPTLVVHHQQDSVALGNTPPVLVTGRDEMIRTMMNYVSREGTPLVDAFYESNQYMRGGAVEHGDLPATGNYDGPEFGECKSNQIVLLSDGDGNYNDSKSFIRNLIESAPTAGTSTTPTCASRDNTHEECGIELARWLAETDHDGDTEGLQPIVTHTIGFNNASPFLTSLAEGGGGSYYQASSASELTSVFKNIINRAITNDTSFIAPTTSANLTNRLVNSNELYFAMFKPSVNAHWDGNLKRFQLAANSTTGKLEVRDALSAVAMESDGTIKDTAKSFWSTNADGGNVSKGGAASRLTLERELYTTRFDSAASKTVFTTFHEDNTLIDLEALGIPAQNSGYRTELLQWARGVDVKDFDGDLNVTEVRTQMGDVMHSSPFILNYPSNSASDDSDTSDTGTRSLLFLGTNHGFLHAIDTADGQEEFAFIPQQLLSNLNYFFRDDTTKHDRRPYGLDGEVSGWHDDTNNNRLVDNDEKAYIYVGMRRGGNDYYALDVSDPAKPKFAWKITGGQGNFAELGQTWSRPVKAKVKYNTVERDVLFFAAGYDEVNDVEGGRSADSKGRGFFMVDAATGAYISSRDHNDFTDMLYSFPSDLRVVSPDGDEFADAIFVGDTGGQLWRFDIDNSATNDSAFIKGYVMADVSGTLDIDDRKFFYEPDVALVRGEEGRLFMNIAIGSGSRPNPNYTDVSDGFYAFRTGSVFGPPRDSDGAIDYPATLTESNLVNTTTSMGSDDTSGKIANGWFMRLPTTGEKSLSSALTVDNELMFTTYVPPGESDDICSANIGGGRVYMLDVFNGNPASGSEVLADRSVELKQPGIPPRVSGLMVEAAPNAVSVLVGLETIEGESYNKPFERTFWAEQ